MKRKMFTHLLKSMFILLLVLGVGKSGWGQESTILNFPLTSNNLPSVYTAGNGSCELTVNATGDPVFGNNGSEVTGWDEGALSKAWTTSAFNTSQFQDLKFNALVASDNDGPKNFLLQYSLNNSNWVTVSAITVTSELNTTPNTPLPAECSNQGEVYLRLIMADNVSISDGTVSEDGKFILKGFVLNGTPPAPPTAQASNITFVSITPTTINVACNLGNGDNRIIVMNTSNSFTLPSDNYDPIANPVYNSGEQVVYNGNLGSVVVTVPSSANTYWFRVFDYNDNDGMIRYITSTATQNPKMCQLETISLPTFTDIRLTTATLGGTISAPASGTITERGIFWSLSTGVNTLSTKAIEGSVTTGLFAFNVSSLTRSRTIYFKAYVTNGSGTTLTSEASFDNIPEFTGTGNWEDNTKWDVQQVPGSSFTYGSSSDRPIINGACTLSSNTTVNTLTINATRSLNINPDYGLTLGSTLSNNGGTAGLVLKSDATGTGSLMHNTANVNATVQRFISGSSNLGAKKYHLVSVPINSTTYLSGVWLDSYLFTYIESTNGWYIWDDPTNNVLQTKQGAMVFYPNWDATTSKTYSITGQLNNGTYSPTVTYGGSGFGFNLVPNPYPSAIDWNAASGWTKTNISGTIWGFNSSTGSYGSWNGTTGTNSVGRYIPVGQAFFVQATGSPTLTMTNSVRLHNTSDFLKSGELVPNILHLIASGNGGQDEIAVQFAYDATETSLDSYDAAKFYSDMQVPQLSTYTSVDNTALSITGLPNSENSSIVPLRFEMDYSGEITFSASAVESFNNSTSIKLEDKQLSQLIDLRTTPNYTFTHTPGDANDRFVLHFGSVLGTGDEQAELAGRVTVSGNQIYVEYPSSASKQLKAAIYDSQGRAISQFKLNGSGQENVTITSSGVYFVKLWLDGGVETHKIVVL